MNEIEKMYENTGVKNKSSKLSAEKLLKLIEWCAAFEELDLIKTGPETIIFICHNVWADTLEEVIVKYINEQLTTWPFGKKDWPFGEKAKEELKRILESED